MIINSDTIKDYDLSQYALKSDIPDTNNFITFREYTIPLINSNSYVTSGSATLGSIANFNNFDILRISILVFVLGNNSSSTANASLTISSSIPNGVGEGSNIVIYPKNKYNYYCNNTLSISGFAIQKYPKFYGNNGLSAQNITKFSFSEGQLNLSPGCTVSCSWSGLTNPSNYVKQVQVTLGLTNYLK